LILEKGKKSAEEEKKKKYLADAMEALIGR
jgi:dsRNA-specific ribonuclease